MIRVLVCWEDEYHAKLDLCLKRALHTVGDGSSPALFFAGVRGNGGFEPYVRRDWPKAVRVGLPKSGGPIDYLVCVADADRAQDCCGVDRPPPAPAGTAEWVTRANELWTGRLRTAATRSADRVIGRFLRWNQESLKRGGGQSTKKGSILRDDALDEISKVGISQLCARAPDLASLAELVQRLVIDPP